MPTLLGFTSISLAQKPREILNLYSRKDAKVAKKSETKQGRME